MENNQFLSKVFIWMFIGLLVTFATGYYVSTNEDMLYNIFSGMWYYVLIIAEFALVIFLSARAYKMSKTTAQISFLAYAFVSGLTFSSIFVVFEMASIMWSFLVAAILFLILALIGRFTKVDLTKWGTYLLIALVATLVFSVINLFVGNTMMDTIISVVIIIIFLGFTAYDVQKLTRLSNSVVNIEALTIIGALDLYLDFINIFLNILSLGGNSRD